MISEMTPATLYLLMSVALAFQALVVSIDNGETKGFVAFFTVVTLLFWPLIVATAAAIAIYFGVGAAGSWLYTKVTGR